ncbi:MAG: hypothetical protein Faunusvirus8_27 [Faunusvirus sp.]|jgi:hypothetical protein|uniref:Uncharacterized protein n=1 Tax=Faunusvirus sp. TaxID=2487766 RepID=A0A3G4ZWT9_9VIRU|nr:MAG: hypothetical protein Faunusvirus8_27 [Faunusvirus sp.]
MAQTFTPFESVFAKLMRTWTAARLSSDVGLIVAQYAGEQITIHYCDHRCDCHEKLITKCARRYDDGYCPCGTRAPSESSLSIQLRELMLRATSKSFSLIKLNNSSDFLLDHIIRIHNAAQCSYEIQPIYNIDIMLKYHDSIVAALFARRSAQLAKLIQMPNKTEFRTIWNASQSLLEYRKKVITLYPGKVGHHDKMAKCRGRAGG